MRGFYPNLDKPPIFKGESFEIGGCRRAPDIVAEFVKIADFQNPLELDDLLESIKNTKSVDPSVGSRSVGRSVGWG